MQLKVKLSKLWTWMKWIAYMYIQLWIKKWEDLIRTQINVRKIFFNMYVHIYILKVCTGHIAHSHLMSLSSPFFCQKSREPPSSAQSTFSQHPVAWLSDPRACWCVWLWSDGQPWPPSWSAATRGHRQQPVDLEAASASLASALTHSLVLHWNTPNQELLDCSPAQLAAGDTPTWRTSINLLTGLVF